MYSYQYSGPQWLPAVLLIVLEELADYLILDEAAAVAARTEILRWQEKRREGQAT